MPDFKKARQEQRQFRTHQVVELEPLPLPSTLPSTSTETYTSPSSRRRGAQAFEQTHSRVTLWLDNGLKARFEALCTSEEVAKSALFAEAVLLLLQKYQA